MAGITRQLPKSNITRKIALSKASNKLANPGPVGVVITPATVTRLNAITPLYIAAYQLVQQREAELAVVTGNKNAGMQILRLLVKHFIGVFNYGVERAKYLAAHRPYFGIPANDANLPNLNTEEAVLNLASNIVEGDPLRVTAGGAAMANPTAAEVDAAQLLAQPLFEAESNAQDALDLAQEALDAHNTEADKVIKKVWDEAEAFFNEEDSASMRQNTRKWGEVYVTQGPPAVLSGLVKDNAGVPQPNLQVVIKETDSTATTNAEGRYQLSTTVLDEVNIAVLIGGIDAASVAVTIPEHTDGININVPDLILP